MKKGTLNLINAVGYVFLTFLVTSLTSVVFWDWLTAAGCLVVGLLGMTILQITGEMPLQDTATRNKLLVIAGIICFLFLPAAFIAAVVWHWIIAAECFFIGVIGAVIVYVMPVENTSPHKGHKQA